MQAMMSMASISHPEGLGGGVGRGWGLWGGSRSRETSVSSTLQPLHLLLQSHRVWLPRLKRVGRLNRCLPSLLNSPHVFGVFAGSLWLIAFTFSCPDF